MRSTICIATRQWHYSRQACGLGLCRARERGCFAMRAVVYRKFGGPEVLEIVPDQPLPQRKSGEVLVRVHSAGCNPLDYKFRNGSIPIATYNKASNMKPCGDPLTAGCHTSSCIGPWRRYCGSDRGRRPKLSGWLVCLLTCHEQRQIAGLCQRTTYLCYAVLTRGQSVLSRTLCRSPRQTRYPAAGSFGIRKA